MSPAVGPGGRSTPGTCAGLARRARTLRRMAALLALLSSLLWGSADFLGGTLSRRLPALLVVGASQLAGLLDGRRRGGCRRRARRADRLPALGGRRRAGRARRARRVLSRRWRWARWASSRRSPRSASWSPWPSASPAASAPVRCSCCGIVVAIVGVVLASGPELSGRAGARPLLLAALAAVGFGLALLFIAEGAQTSTLMTLVAMRVDVGAGGRAPAGRRARPPDRSAAVHPRPGADRGRRHRRRRCQPRVRLVRAPAAWSASWRCSVRCTRSSPCCWPGSCTTSGWPRLQNDRGRSLRSPVWC